MAETDSVTVTITVDLDGWRRVAQEAQATLRLLAARFAYLGAITGVLTEDVLGGDGSATNARRTDARDAYYTARDLTEEPR